MLDEVNELLEILQDQDAKHIDTDKTMAMVNLCYACVDIVRNLAL